MARKRLISRTPQTWLGTLSEWCVGTAGRSIAIGERWYRFSRQRGVVESDAALAERPGLFVEDCGEAPGVEASALAAMVGRKWSPFYNCATAFSPFWSRSMSQIGPGDRSAVARHVVVSVLVALAMLVAVLLALNWFVDVKLAPIHEKLDRMQRSNAAHFGWIKSQINAGGSSPAAEDLPPRVSPPTHTGP